MQERSVTHGLPALDLRPLQEGHALRGIGRYVSTLASALPYTDVVVWSGLPLPSAVGTATPHAVPGSPAPGRLGWLRDLRVRRDASLAPVHVPLADVRLSRPAPAVITAFDAIPWRFPGDYPAGVLGAWRRRGDAVVARRAPRVITISEASSRDLQQFLGVPERVIHVVPLAAGAPWPEPAPGEGRARPPSLRHGRRYVVASGGFVHADPRKRLADLLRALVALPDEIGLVVTGAHGPAQEPFLALARELGVSERVELTGQLPVEEVVRLYSGAAAFAFPSAWEGFGLPLVEAMSVGLPCVVTDGGALPEVAAGAATVVPVARPRDLADALSELLGDSRRAEEASLRSTRRAAELTVARCSTAHLKVYASL